MKIGLAAAVVVAMTAPGVAQTTGVSHPENVPITASPEPLQPAYQAAPAYQATPAYQPTPGYTPTPVYQTYQPAPATASGLRSRTDASAPPVASVPPRESSVPLDPDAMIVGDEFTPITRPEERGSSLEGTRDLDAGIVTRVPGPANELPVGTVLKARIHQSLKTGATAVGTPFTAELTEPALRDGRVLLPAGSVVEGKVTEVHGGRRIAGGAAIHLQPMSITLPDGTRYKMIGQVIDTDLFRQTKVDSEGTITRREHKAETAAALGLATGAGVAAGGVYGGVPGALIGGAIGAGVGTVVWLKQDREEELPAGTKLVFSLNAPIAVQ